MSKLNLSPSRTEVFCKPVVSQIQKWASFWVLQVSLHPAFEIASNGMFEQARTSTKALEK